MYYSENECSKAISVNNDKDCLLDPTRQFFCILFPTRLQLLCLSLYGSFLARILPTQFNQNPLP